MASADPSATDPNATTVLVLRAWTGRPRLDRPLRDADALATTLNAWLDGR